MENQADSKTTPDVRPFVRERYGKAAAEFQPEAGTGCCGTDGADSLIQLSQLYEGPDVDDLPVEVTGLSMGCGDPVTLASLESGQTVLDLGSGGGIDCFLAAKQVGDSGTVIGVDMTPEMIEKARANKAKLGADNVEFRLGEIEHLPVADGSVDVILSNCVINLSPDKPQVFREAYRVLKPGGRLAVSDIVTDGPMPDVIKENMSAWAGCVAGALDVQEYVAAIKAAGFVDVETTPDYWDESLIEAAKEQIDISEVNQDGCCTMVINDGTETHTIEIDSELDLDETSLQKSVFSAKIKARKPLKME